MMISNCFIQCFYIINIFMPFLFQRTEEKHRFELPKHCRTYLAQANRRNVIVCVMFEEVDKVFTSYLLLLLNNNYKKLLLTFYKSPNVSSSFFVVVVCISLLSLDMNIQWSLEILNLCNQVK